MSQPELREAHTAASVALGDAARVLSAAVLRSSELLGLSRAALARVLGVSEAGISRLANGARAIDPASKEGELALLLVRLYRSLDALVGNDAAQRLRWLDSYDRGVNGRPVELIERAEGLAGVVAYLDGMRAPL
jgi:transcriptional regulator with XRE-family HTH domain